MKQYGLLAVGVRYSIELVLVGGLFAFLETAAPGKSDALLAEYVPLLVERFPSMGSVVETYAEVLPANFVAAFLVGDIANYALLPLALLITVRLGRRGWGWRLGAGLLVVSGAGVGGLLVFALRQKQGSRAVADIQQQQREIARCLAEYPASQQREGHVQALQRQLVGRVVSYIDSPLCALPEEQAACVLRDLQAGRYGPASEGLVAVVQERCGK